MRGEAPGRGAVRASPYLVIADDFAAPALDAALRDAERGVAVDVLLLSRSAEWYARQRVLPPAMRFVDVASLAGRAHEDVAAFLIPYVHGLPDMPLDGLTLARLMGGTGPESPWWHLEITEKGPYRGPLVGQLYRVALIAGALAAGQYARVVASVRDRGLAAVLERHAARERSWTLIHAHPTSRPSVAERFPRAVHTLRIVAEAVRLTLVAATSRALSLWPAGPWGGKPVIFTFFPEWWTTPATPRAAERFFSGTADGPVAGYLAWCTSLRSLWSHRAGAVANMRRLRMTPLQSWSRPSDISWGSLRRLDTFLRRMRPHVRAAFRGFDVSMLLQAELTRSLASIEAIRNPALTRAARRAVAQTRPSALLYRLEWQPLERALLASLPPTTPGIGYLHYPFGERYLSMRFTAEEMEQGLQTRGGAAPMPGLILTSGPALARGMTVQGFPESRVLLAGPQRYARLIARQPDPAARERVRRSLGIAATAPLAVVAPAILEDDSEALAAALLHAARTMDGLRIIIKTHPNRPDAGPALRTVVDELGPARAGLMPADAALYEYLEAADALVCIGSMIAFEAMALGTMPIVFENPSTYAATSLREFASALCVVTDGESLSGALAQTIAAAPADAERRRAWRQVLADVFGDLETPAPRQMADALARAGVLHSS
jgi:hypothetical protein